MLSGRYLAAVDFVDLASKRAPFALLVGVAGKGISGAALVLFLGTVAWQPVAAAVGAALAVVGAVAWWVAAKVVGDKLGTPMRTSALRMWGIPTWTALADIVDAF